jgi:hypothetical protein
MKITGDHVRIQNVWACIGCSERRLIWLSFYCRNFLRKSSATCRAKCRHSALRTEKSDKPAQWTLHISSMSVAMSFKMCDICNELNDYLRDSDSGELSWWWQWKHGGKKLSVYFDLDLAKFFWGSSVSIVIYEHSLEVNVHNLHVAGHEILESRRLNSRNKWRISCSNFKTLCIMYIYTWYVYFNNSIKQHKFVFIFTL